MSSVTFSVPVNTGTNAVTASDLTINSGTWNTHSSATASNSLNTTLSRIVAEIPSSVAQTSGASDISGATASSTASTRAIDVKTYVEAKVPALVDDAPSLLNTLDELAAAINDDANYATTITTALGTKAALAGSSSQAFSASTLTAATSATMPKLLSTAPGGAGLQIGSDAATNKYRLVVKDDSVIVNKGTPGTAVMTISG